MRAAPRPSPVSLPARAADDLRFIRGAMERSAHFTAVPGAGGVAMGAIAVAAAVGARFTDGRAAWLTLWAGAAVLAIAVGAVAMHRKAARMGVTVLQGPGRRFLLCLCPSLLAGALLTAALARAGQYDLLPATWLLCYGAGIVAAGAFSTHVVPVTGGAFLALGAAALAAPPDWGDAMMAAGFGGIHVVSGLVIARRHGG